MTEPANKEPERILTLEKEYLWAHFAFNADQRLKAFNFYVVFSVFANGGVFAAVEKDMADWVFICAGFFICALSGVFAIIDTRSKWLINLSVAGLKAYEEIFPPRARLFQNDENRHSFIRFTVAFRVLFVLQFIFGLAAVAYGFGFRLC